MSDVVVAPPEPAFAEYLKAENARELREERGDLDPVEPTPAPAKAALETSQSSSEPQDEAAPQQESVEPVKADDERNPDGTFKPKTTKVTNTGEWKRNAKLTAELRAAQEEIQRLRMPAANPAPQQNQTPVILDPRDPEPTIDAFLDKPDPYAALAVAAGKWAVREERRIQARESEQVQVRQAQSELAEREQQFTSEHPDYFDAVNPVIALFKQHDRVAVLSAIADDDLGPAVAYHLATHPDEAQRIALLTPVAGVKEIGKLSSRLTPATVGSGAPAVSTSKAKPLIKPVSGAPVAPESSPPDLQPFGAKYIREMNAKERREREGLR